MKPVFCTHILKVTPHPCLRAVQVKQAILVKIPHFAYNFTWLASSAGVLSKTFFIAQPTPPEGIWSRDRTYVGNAQLFHLVIHTFPPVASWACTPQHLPNASLKSLIYWDCTNQRHCTCRGRCSHLPPAWEPTEDSSQGRVDAHAQSSFPGALRAPGVIRCRPQNKLPDPWYPEMLGYIVCQHTRITSAIVSGVRISIWFLSAFHLVTPVVNPKLN